MSSAGQKTRKGREMASSGDHDMGAHSALKNARCIVLGCIRKPQAEDRDGFSRAYCKRHIEHIRRHGHSFGKTPSKAVLAPFRIAIRRWYSKHHHERRVQDVVRCLDALLLHSDGVISAYDLRGLSVQKRASNVLARNQKAGKTGIDLLQVALLLRAYVAAHGPRGSQRYLHTQIAKLLHRVSSGTNRTSSGFPIPRKNPRPEGRFMVHLGKQVDDIAGIVANDEAVAEVLQIVEEISSRSRDPA